MSVSGPVTWYLSEIVFWRGRDPGGRRGQFLEAVIAGQLSRQHAAAVGRNLPRVPCVKKHRAIVPVLPVLPPQIASQS
jgi:hypothetical protein